MKNRPEYNPGKLPDEYTEIDNALNYLYQAIENFDPMAEVELIERAILELQKYNQYQEDDDDTD